MKAVERGLGGAKEEPQAGQEEGDHWAPGDCGRPWGAAYGYAGTRKRGLGNMLKEEDISSEVSNSDSIKTKEQGDPYAGSGEAAGEDPLEKQEDC